MQLYFFFAFAECFEQLGHQSRQLNDDPFSRITSRGIAGDRHVLSCQEQSMKAVSLLLQILLLFTVAGTISAAVRSRFEAAARECYSCHGYGINR